MFLFLFMAGLNSQFHAFAAVILIQEGVNYTFFIAHMLIVLVYNGGVDSKSCYMSLMISNLIFHFLNVKKVEPIGIHWQLSEIYGGNEIISDKMNLTIQYGHDQVYDKEQSEYPYLVRYTPMMACTPTHQNHTDASLKRALWPGR